MNTPLKREFQKAMRAEMRALEKVRAAVKKYNEAVARRKEAARKFIEPIMALQDSESQEGQSE